jgi:transposase
VIPVIFTYGSIRKEPEYSDRALRFLEKLGPEENSIISDWKSVGIEPASAFDTQALLQLRLEYCRRRRCLECRIGQKLISDGARLKDPEETLLEP